MTQAACGCSTSAAPAATRDAGTTCRSLAEARGQRPMPDVKTIEDLKSEAYVRALEAEIQPLVQRDAASRRERALPARRLPRKASRVTRPSPSKLFARVRVPLLRVLFARAEGSWRLDARAGHRPCRHSAAEPRVPARGGQVVHRRKLRRPSGRAPRGTGRDWRSCGTRTNRTSPPTRKRCSGS